LRHGGQSGNHEQGRDARKRNKTLFTDKREDLEIAGSGGQNKSVAHGLDSGEPMAQFCGGGTDRQPHGTLQSVE
jgi:hypothetical protein